MTFWLNKYWIHCYHMLRIYILTRTLLGGFNFLDLSFAFGCELTPCYFLYNRYTITRTAHGFLLCFISFFSFYFLPFLRTEV